IFANRAWDRITVFPFALGSEKGIETIHIAPKNTGTSRFDVTATGLPSDIFQETQSITVERFDDVAPFHKIVDARAFIKIDVEGHTVDVIAGMNRFLRSNICRLQIELFDRERDGVIASLRALGYEIAEVIGDDHYFVKRATAR
ncbi:MAG: FkbM family methyltransferase, partial [Sphingomonas sp.]|nr:FkbM family methyltransferase [Sphingomonas sp.]